MLPKELASSLSLSLSLSLSGFFSLSWFFCLIFVTESRKLRLLHFVSTKHESRVGSNSSMDTRFRCFPTSVFYSLDVGLSGRGNDGSRGRSNLISLDGR